VQLLEKEVGSFLKEFFRVEHFCAREHEDGGKMNIKKDTGGESTPSVAKKRAEGLR